MKIIFLDIDGVLVTPTTHTEYLKYKEIAKKTGVLYSERTIFDDDAIENINTLIDKTGAFIVIISHWLITKRLESIKSTLADVGFRYWYKILNTDNSFFIKVKRSEEIKNFLSTVVHVHGYHEEYVIIDIFKDYEDYQLKHLVSPDLEKGFSSEDLEKAIKILEGVK